MVLMKSSSSPLARYVFAAGMALATPAPIATAEQSPIFGSARIEAMSDAASRDISARGYWANYYGSAAISNAYNAYIYAFYARNYATANSATEQSWYATAHQAAYNAYAYSYLAYYYSTLGM